MKKIKIVSVLAISFLVFSSAIKIMFPAKSSVLEIKGYVYHNDEKVDKAKVKLFQNNKVVQLSTTKKSKFQFMLFSGMQYMVEIDKPNFIQERIQISTKEKTEFNGKYLYEFKVDLVEATTLKGVDISNLDFPTAIIKYNKDEGEYMYDEAYSKQIRVEMKALKLKAKKAKN